MKSKIILPLIIPFAILISSCEILPDLNPNTNQGSDITVFDINDSILVEEYSLKNYDLNNDGIIEFQINHIIDHGLICPNHIDIVTLDVNGQIFAPLTGNYFLEEGIITGINGALGAFEATQAELLNHASFCIRTSNVRQEETRYVITKFQYENRLHYAWLEFTIEYGFIHATLILTRVGVANQPNFVLRAGQTD